jgi:5'-phosphate synthase pdxT subunit
VDGDERLTGDASMTSAAIGILCLQGDYEAHGRVLDRLGVAWREVRRRGDLAGLRGLVLPGGESTTMWHFLRQNDFAPALADWAAAGGALYGTCAGAILLSRDIRNPAGEGFGLLDITVERNAYGRQLQSAVRRAVLEDTGDLDPPASPGDSIETVLIRAPRILRTGPEVRVRARLDGDPVWVEQGRVVATTFHPELGAEERPHRLFLRLAGVDATRPNAAVRPNTAVHPNAAVPPNTAVRVDSR